MPSRAACSPRVPPGKHAVGLDLGDHPGELGAVADELQALVLGVADVIDIVSAGGAVARSGDGVVERGGVGDAGAPALFGQAQIVVLAQPDPLALVLHQHALGHRIVIAGDIPNAGRQFFPIQYANDVTGQFHHSASMPSTFLRQKSACSLSWPIWVTASSFVSAVATVP